MATNNKKNGEWVWMLVDEVIAEGEWESTLWRDKAKAKAAMEEKIKEAIEFYEDLELEREDDDHACLGDERTWSISKVWLNN